MRSAHLISLCAATLLAQTPVGAQTIPLRKLTQVVATDSGALAGFLGLRPLANGSVMVNDATNYRLIVFDSTLSRPARFADNEGAPNRYGTSQGVLMSYLADTILLFDFDATAFVVIDPTPRVVRSMALARAQDRIAIGGGWQGAQGFDPAGRFVFRTVRSQPREPPAVSVGVSGTITTSVRRDSFAIMRVDPANGAVDTVGIGAVAVTKRVYMSMGSARGPVSTNAINPLPQPDEWTMLPDGTIAIVRGIDYHIDWIAPNGMKTSTPKMPFDWRRVTEEEKLKMIDSTKKAAEARAAAPPLPRPANSPFPPNPLPRIPTQIVDASELPDYYPPIRGGTVKADRDGNVWILPTTSRLSTGGLVYDVVNRKGEIIERVELPAGRNIAGFARGGIIYMSSAYGPGATRIERARISR
jgi:hypothetical protein